MTTVHTELRAVLADRDPTLAETLDTRFAVLQDASGATAPPGPRTRRPTPPRWRRPIILGAG